MQGSYSLPASYTTLTVLDTAVEFLAELQTDRRVLAFCPVFTLKGYSSPFSHPCQPLEKVKA